MAAFQRMKKEPDPGTVSVRHNVMGRAVVVELLPKRALLSSEHGDILVTPKDSFNDSTIDLCNIFKKGDKVVYKAIHKPDSHVDSTLTRYLAVFVRAISDCMLGVGRVVSVHPNMAFIEATIANNPINIFLPTSSFHEPAIAFIFRQRQAAFSKILRVGDLVNFIAVQDVSTRDRAAFGLEVTFAFNQNLTTLPVIGIITEVRRSACDVWAKNFCDHQFTLTSVEFVRSPDADDYKDLDLREILQVGTRIRFRGVDRGVNCDVADVEIIDVEETEMLRKFLVGKRIADGKNPIVENSSTAARTSGLQKEEICENGGNRLSIGHTGSEKKILGNVKKETDSISKDQERMVRGLESITDQFSDVHMPSIYDTDAIIKQIQQELSNLSPTCDRDQRAIKSPHSDTITAPREKIDNLLLEAPIIDRYADQKLEVHIDALSQSSTDRSMPSGNSLLTSDHVKRDQEPTFRNSESNHSTLDSPDSEKFATVVASPGFKATSQYGNYQKMRYDHSIPNQSITKSLNLGPPPGFSPPDQPVSSDLDQNSDVAQSSSASFVKEEFMKNKKDVGCQANLDTDEAILKELFTDEQIFKLACDHFMPLVHEIWSSMRR